MTKAQNLLFSADVAWRNFFNSSSHSALNSSLTLVVIDFVRFCFILRIQWLSLRLLYSLWIDQFYRRAKKFKAVFFSCVSQLSRYVILSYSAAYMTHHYHHDKHMLPTIFSKKSYSIMQVFLQKSKKWPAKTSFSPRSSPLRTFRAAKSEEKRMFTQAK